MENIPATNNALFVSTNTGQVGISTAAPQATLDVAGNMQVGQGANKSTFTVAGALNINAGQNVTVSAGGVFSGPLSGNATTATNIASGGAGQIPYQTGGGATAFLPSMAAGGIVVGNGSGVIPSTAALQGTTNRVTVTQSATAITLSAPQDINSGAAPTFTGTNFTGIPESGVTSLTTDLSNRVLKAGDTMTGNLNMSGVATGVIVEPNKAYASTFTAQGLNEFYGITASTLTATTSLTVNGGAVLGVSSQTLSGPVTVTQGGVQIPDGQKYKEDTYAGSYLQMGNALTLNGNNGVNINTAGGQTSVGGSLTVAGSSVTATGVGSDGVAISGSGSGNTFIKVKSTAGGNNGYQFDNGTNIEYWYRTGDDVRFQDLTTDRVTFKNGGNVGIGTTSPASSATLHIAGGGNLSVDNKIEVGPGGLCFSASGGACQTGVGGGGTVTTQGSPQAGQIAVFQGGTVLSSGPFIVAGGTVTAPAGSVLAISGGATMIVNNGAYAVWGDAATGRMLNSSGLSAYAKSIDGTTQSSGCLVAMQFMNTNANGAWFSATADTATLVFTSTTTTLTKVGTSVMPGVLLESCAPGSICRVGIKGMYRIQTTGASSQYPEFTTTRCAAGADNAFDASAVGGYMTTNPAAGMTWIQLR